MATTQLRHKSTGLYGIEAAPSPHFYAFFLDGSDVVASTYSAAGGWIEDRGTLTGGAADLFDDARCVIADPQENVGAGAIAYVSANNAIAVWDVQNATDYLYEATGTLRVGLLNYYDGRLYWWEWEPTFAPLSDVTVTLRRALCDLTSVEDLGSAVCDTGAADNDFFGPEGGHALNSVAAIAGFTAAGGESQQSTTVRITLAGVASQDAGLMEAISAVPDAGVLSIGAYGDAPDRTLYALPDDLSGDPVARWPATANWTIDSGTASTSEDRQTALIYGARSAEGGQWAIEAASTATSGEPTLEVQISTHPTSENAPVYLFLME